MSKEYTKVSECNEPYYKCHKCYHILKESQLINGICPCCGNEVVLMCSNDTIEKCTHNIVSGIAFCEICGAPICPVCGKHDGVTPISRITGYLSSVSGWNAGKIAELQDRKKYDI